MLINTLRNSCGETHSESSAEKCWGGIGRSSAPDCRVLSGLQHGWEKQCWAVPSPPREWRSVPHIPWACSLKSDANGGHTNDYFVPLLAAFSVLLFSLQAVSGQQSQWERGLLHTAVCHCVLGKPPLPLHWPGCRQGGCQQSTLSSSPTALKYLPLLGLGDALAGHTSLLRFWGWRNKAGTNVCAGKTQWLWLIYCGWLIPGLGS